jgi:transglutaminase-like putative cysteine protease
MNAISLAQTTERRTRVRRKSRRLAIIHLTARGCLWALWLTLLAGPLDAQETFQSWLQKANLAKTRGDFAAMEKALTHAHALGPGDEYTWRSLAWAEARQGKWQPSLEHARENLRRHGECGWPLQQLFDSAMVAGDMDLARATLKQADHLAPPLRQDVDFTEYWRQLEGVTAPRRYRLTYVVDDKSTTAPLRYLLPALRASRQTFAVTVIDAKTWRVFTEGRDSLLEVTPRPDKPFRIIGTVTLQPICIGPKRLAQVPPGPAPSSLQTLLGPFHNGPRLDPSQPDCLAVARPLRGRTSAETVQNILNWLKVNMIREPPYGPDTLSAILTNRHGLCHHHVQIMTSLCRAAGVPAVIAHGNVLPEAKGEIALGHGWVEVYLNGLGWVPVEPMNPDSLRCFGGANYMLMHTAGHTPVENHFTPRYVSLQGRVCQVERLP